MKKILELVKKAQNQLLNQEISIQQALQDNRNTEQDIQTLSKELSESLSQQTLVLSSQVKGGFYTEESKSELLKTARRIGIKEPRRYTVPELLGAISLAKKKNKFK